MKHIRNVLLMLLIILPAGVMAAEKPSSFRLYDLEEKNILPLSDALPELKQSRVILVGESHTAEHHHRGQLAVIQALREAGIPVAIGMEMFRAESQPELDLWIAGTKEPTTFIRVYYDNWNYPWPLYADILEYARKHRIPTIGLNVSRELTRQVANAGFASLTPEQKGLLPEEVVCRVDEKYMRFIQRAYGVHAHGKLNFGHFCEAQLVWDKAMAIHAIRYLKAHPDTVMVILTGNGHAWKLGIPEQIRTREEFPTTVILPQIPGHIDPDTVNVQDADYLMIPPQ